MNLNPSLNRAPIRTRYQGRSIDRRSVIGSTLAGLATATTGSRFFGLALAQTPAATPVSAGHLNVRPNAATLNPDQKRAYVDAVLALKAKPSPWVDSLSTYDTFVMWHRDAFGCGINAAHMGPAFFPWHRVFLHLFEQQLKAVDASVSLPYWDWATDRATDSYVWQDVFMGGDGSDADDEAVVNGPFQKGKWELTVFDYSDTQRTPWISRDLGMGGLAPDLPTADDVEAALTVPTYDSEPWSAQSAPADSFRNTFEGWRDCVEDMCDPTAGAGTVCTGEHLLHNRVPLWVSGEFAFSHELQAQAMSMGTATPAPTDDMVLGTMAANSSPNDPVFFLHHANIDRLWSVWTARHGQRYLPESGGPVGHNIDDMMWPYHQIGMDVSPRMVLDSRSFGYVYDSETP